MPKSQLFRKKNDTELRSELIRARCTPSEAAELREKARIRNLTLSEYLIRAGLGRRADVDMETEIVLATIANTEEIRSLHEDYIANGLNAPTEELNAMIRNNIRTVAIAEELREMRS